MIISVVYFFLLLDNYVQVSCTVVHHFLYYVLRIRTSSIVNAGLVSFAEGSAITETLTLAGTVTLMLLAEIAMNGGFAACMSSIIPILG